jgi:hypothetical protein
VTFTFGWRARKRPATPSCSPRSSGRSRPRSSLIPSTLASTGSTSPYLQLHPYAEQLHINVFNPGDAGFIAESLRSLEVLRKELRGEPALRYVVRLFAPREGVDLTGSALESLLDPALLWAQRSTDPRFTQRPQKIVVRPRFTQHGGGTKTALAGQTVR